MEAPPLNEAIYSPDAPITNAWTVWFKKLWVTAGSVDNSGTTANRPTQNLFVNKPYFDTTLGYPIWVKSVRPTVWVNAMGASV